MVFGIQEIYLTTWDASTELWFAWGITSHEIDTFFRDLRFGNDMFRFPNFKISKFMDLGSSMHHG